VIEFMASDFHKDRIWMRRVRAEKRMYDVMIAIDNSASMGDGCIKAGDDANGNEAVTAGVVALDAVALVMSAMTKLEVGRVGKQYFIQ